MAEERFINFSNPAALGAFMRGDFDNALVASTPGGIEAQEAAGQKQLASSASQLPKDGIARTELTSLGFVLGPDTEDLFVLAQFPAGWKIEPTSHALHSDLVDPSGAKRGGISYKAAFYDRWANMHLNRRYYVSNYYKEGGDPNKMYDRYQTAVMDNETGKAVYVVDIPQGEEEKSWDYHERTTHIAYAWLYFRYPEAEDPLAYWTVQPPVVKSAPMYKNHLIHILQVLRDGPCQITADGDRTFKTCHDLKLDEKTFRALEITKWISYSLIQHPNSWDTSKVWSITDAGKKAIEEYDAL